ncbi:MinD/ParA family ATP-binding protein [Thermoleptolyngbya sp.]|jgi:septum site-determining protein MinD
MARIVSIHSFRGGTGKSNTAANLAALLSKHGQRVGVIDTDIQSPGIHVLFGLEPSRMKNTLNDYLWGDCTIAESAYDVTVPDFKTGEGSVYLVPSKSSAEDIARVLREGYDVRLLRSGLQDLVKAYNLDYVLIDTHPGLNEETLLALAMSNLLLLVLRPDQQDFQGTAVVLDLARKLRVPKILMLINRVLASVDVEDLKKQVESIYSNEVGAVLPNCDEMMQLGSSDLFTVRYRDHPLSQEMDRLVRQMLSFE